MTRPSCSHPKSDADRATDILRALDELQAGVELHILSVSEPVTSAIDAALQQKQTERGASSGQGRTSDVSTASAEAPTPASLDADLAHFRDLFAKLRFSYVEQETKEKFIRYIVGDPPIIVTPAENADLEARNAIAKATLKALKLDVAALVARLEERARELTQRHERLAADALLLRDLPAQIRELEARVAELRRQTNPARGGGGGGGGDGDVQEQLNLPLAQTSRLVDERRARARELDRQLEQLAAQAPRRRKEVDRLQAELGPLEARRASSTAAAREARRRKEAALGGDADDLEERARWFRGSEAALRQLLDLQG